jgi:hypothetical protein
MRVCVLLGSRNGRGMGWNGMEFICLFETYPPGIATRTCAAVECAYEDDDEDEDEDDDEEEDAKAALKSAPLCKCHA